MGEATVPQTHGAGGGEGQSGDPTEARVHGGAGKGQRPSPQKLKVPKRRLSREGGTRKRAWSCVRTHWLAGVWRGRWRDSEPGLADAGLLQIVATTPAISGDFPENGEHGMPDSVGQSWDVIWCQPFCGHWRQHPDLTSPWEGGAVRACLSRPLPVWGPVSELLLLLSEPPRALLPTLDNCPSACLMPPGP